MKKDRFIFQTVAVAIITLIFVSCSEDFLDREPSNYLTGEQIEDYAPFNPEIAKGMVRGIYSTTFAYGTGGTGDHDDFGQKSIDITTDLMSGDMVLVGKNYNWFSSEYELTAMTKTSSRAYKNWYYYYQIVKSANSVIDGLSAYDSLDINNQHSLGQAFSLRAYAYYNLVNLYQHPYGDDPDALAIPMYLSQTIPEAAPLVSVDSVYDIVIADLDTALVLLEGFNREAKNEIDITVAKGLLAYAKLATQQYSDAADLATDLIGSGSYQLMSSEDVIQSGFSSVNNAGWMWGVDITDDNTSGLASFWGHVDVFTYSYAGAGDGKAIDISLYESIPDNDVRKQQFSYNESDPYHLHPTYKFYDSQRTVFADRMWTNDIVYMRIAEMYLLAAEAYSHYDIPEAKRMVNLLLSEREPGASSRINGMSDEEFLNELHLQWRIEFWGEGKSLFALKRMQRTATRGDNHRALANTSYAYNSENMIFAVPEDELINNPNIDENAPGELITP